MTELYKIIQETSSHPLTNRTDLCLTGKMFRSDKHFVQLYAPQKFRKKYFFSATFSYFLD